MTKMKRKSSTSSDVESPAKKPKKGPVAAVEVVKEKTVLPSTSSVCSEFSAHCSNIRQIFRDAKAQLDDGKDVQDVCNQGIVTLSKLMSLHRTRVSQVSAGQQATHEAMVASEKYTLKLQNLQYEEDNLQHKIDETRNSPVIADVDLLPEEDFASQAPEHLKTLARQGEHMHQLTRLQFEIMHRAQLAQDLKSVQRQVSTVAKEIGGCERQHEAVSTELRQLLEVAKTFEKKTCFSKRPSPSTPAVQPQQQPVTGEEVVLELEGADHLPEPLYLLCKKAQLACTGPGCLLSISVEKGCKIGTLDNAQSLVGQACAGYTSQPPPPAEAFALIEPHPYSCTVTVSTQGTGKAVKLQFFYHPTLMLISVDHNVAALAALASLEAGDAGLTCPRLLPSCHSQFTGQLPLLLQAGALGRLYHWAQRLAGLEFLSVAKRQENGSSTGSEGATPTSPCFSWSQIIDILSSHL